MTKKELRQFIRNEKRHFSQQELREMSLSVIESLLHHPKMRDADVVLLYYSLDDEVYTHDIIQELVAMGKTVLLPRVVSETEMELRDVSVVLDGEMECVGPGWLADTFPVGNYPLFTGSFGPTTLFVIPGMAFDDSGNRLGRGKGYYDRFLAQHPNIYRIGVCFPFQKVDNVPVESTDLPMHEVL